MLNNQAAALNANHFTTANTKKNTQQNTTKKATHTLGHNEPAR
jgi:hypothetical protein